jgi:hypothetical protein
MTDFGPLQVESMYVVMRKTRFFAMALALLTWPLLSNGQSSHDPQKSPVKTTQQITNKKGSPQENTTTINQIIASDNDEKAIAYSQGKKEKTPSDWWLIGFTGALVIVALLQSLILCKQINTSRDIERAWILVSVKAPIQNATGFWIVPEVTNHGKTVARITKFSVRWQIVNNHSDLAQEPSYGQENSANAIVPPNDRIFPMSTVIAAQNYNNALAPQGFLYVYGFVDYEIVGRKKRTTRFCFMHYPALATQPMPPGFYVGIQAPQSYTQST